ncbi:longevity assurance proteins LAG1/LAC1 [Dothidotthia symphoricarpi CBS 119687]|uniref:Longevity assurance proteins LAG1/LAC1 n=1 Tax=Dothidotthia symphoricarpi CBS 119687 TaxID=1392245 RepID=A0A6A6AUS1_9PLEO|nr:longevity assurance proteins LAG1/LAC1 [Dothidotthia symphoricarpi CBS 119687]KAF2134715.1 longevity assurance proteins LAG1/LAC1 [Dothidotthia symphoricarpi CBS 119687]
MATKTAPPNGTATLNKAHTAELQEHKVVVAPRRRGIKPKKVEDEGLMASLCTLLCDHQMGISINLLSLLCLTHLFFPRACSQTTKFFTMSYYNPETEMYGCGADDLPFVMLWTLLFTGLRVLAMEFLLDPLARCAGIRTKKGLDRFKEQAWLVVYYTGSWSLAMYIMYHSDFWLNLPAVWEGWPFREIDGLFKWYYLVQLAFWIQQLLVVNIEEKRSDYAQMFTHHIFTTALIGVSYSFYHTRVGTVILCIMDFVDIVLPTAKLLKYMGYTTACDIAFGVFVIAWIITRHALFMTVCWSIYAHADVYIPHACHLIDKTVVYATDAARYDAAGGNQIWANLFSAYRDPNGPVCWMPSIRWYFLALLLSLQVFCCIWFCSIVKVVYKVLEGAGAEDVRSDDDEDELVENDTVLNAANANADSGLSAPPKEEEVGVEALTFARMNGASQRRQNRVSSSRASGISIPGHGDRKELLGRIGCDKPS